MDITIKKEPLSDIRDTKPEQDCGFPPVKEEYENQKNIVISENHDEGLLSSQIISDSFGSNLHDLQPGYSLGLLPTVCKEELEWPPVKEEHFEDQSNILSLSESNDELINRVAHDGAGSNIQDLRIGSSIEFLPAVCKEELKLESVTMECGDVDEIPGDSRGDESGYLEGPPQTTDRNIREAISKGIASGLSARKRKNDSILPNITVNTVDKPFSCHHCGKCFGCESRLRSHLKIHSDERPFSCVLCGKCFVEKSYLARHLMMHSGENPFPCAYCKKRFPWKSSLVIHLRVHSGEKPFSCPHCTKSFTQKGSLTGHLKVHSAEKSFSCPHCAKSFAQKYYLARHLRVHSGEKQFSCHYCGKGFASKGQLPGHFLNHSGEKPFSCPYCTKCFALKSNLTRHLRVHSSEKPFSCPHCAKCFVRKVSLTRHLEANLYLGRTCTPRILVRRRAFAEVKSRK